ncbi:hypothetical protein EYF80_028030 [Liparis tanakae]|uniref:Uncharacterized protein n=1 Tax=Liparis tanakae TaxID=230148 RepID=A0A4Z2H7V2_9TELE|nr:hypothetical protein EYF80_028030 [Liparis tanakae]
MISASHGNIRKAELTEVGPGKSPRISAMRMNGLVGGAATTDDELLRAGDVVIYTSVSRGRHFQENILTKNSKGDLHRRRALDFGTMASLCRRL